MKQTTHDWLIFTTKDLSTDPPLEGEGEGFSKGMGRGHLQADKVF